MSTGEIRYAAQNQDHASVMEIVEVYQPLQVSDGASQYSYLTGITKWVRYGWYPFIDIISLLGGGLAIASLFSHGVSQVDLGVMFFMFNLVGLAGEAGMHRLFAHRSYKVAKPIRILLALAGSMAGEAPIIEYVAYHRRHHIYADHDGDLHSPHYIDAGEPWAWLRNIWHAFFGWKYNNNTNRIAPPDQYAKDILAEPAMVIIDRYFYTIVLFSFLLPAILGFLFTKNIHGAWTSFLWGGCFRFVVMTLMGDLIIRAGCHLFGTRPFVDQAKSQSTNIWFLGVPTFGLAWHNNHHAFPGSALLNIDWWQVDPSGSFISLLGKLGLAWNIKTPTLEQVKLRRVNI
jgi:stearoyl-CoA desaturase (Delta-9 desaturase)